MRILIVDDDLVSREKLRKIMDNFGQCIVVENGADALRVATSQNSPDLILLDIIMPGMDGYEVCKRLKANKRTSNIPVIFISAKSEEADETQGLELGAVDYITKPFSPSIVKVRVRTHLELKKHRNRLEELVNERTVELKKATKEMQVEIEERKQLEEALRESEAVHWRLIDKLDDIIWTLDLDLRTTYVSPSIEKKLGFTPEERMAQDPGEQMTPTSYARMTELLIKELEQEQRAGVDPERRLRVEVEYYHKNGATLWFENIVSGIRDEKGVVFGIHGVSRDITDRKQAKEALVFERAQLLSIFDSIDEIVYVTDPDTYEILYVNQALKDAFQKELIGGVCYREFQGLDFPCEFCTNEIILKQKPSPHRWEYHNPTLDKDFAIVDRIIKWPDGRDVRFEFAIDVTDLKRAEEGKKKLEAQFQQAQKMESLGSLAGGIAHDFNNLLMGIQGRTSLMLMYKDSSHPDFGHLSGIEDYIKNAVNLTKQLLGFARAGKYEVKPTDINDLIKKSSTLFGRTKKEIAIRSKYQEDVWTLEVDRGQIEQVLLNLFVNAWHAMPGGGNLFIETENVTVDKSFIRPFEVQPGKYVEISIVDKGVGMDEMTRQRIFEPFFTTRKMGRGTGLGLASVYGIIKNHGGFIDVYSEKGHGTTFNIYLRASAKEIIEEKKPSGDILRGTETVLFVDDEAMIIEVTEELFKELGYKVLIARGGKEAIEIYEENKERIDIVILDMIMPDMSGGVTYDRMKEIDPDIKVLLSSGYSINGQATEILDRGCNGFIQKPFKMKELSQKLREILDEK